MTTTVNLINLFLSRYTLTKEKTHNFFFLFVVLFISITFLSVLIHFINMDKSLINL